MLAPGLMSETALSTWKAGTDSSRVFSRFGGPQSDPGLEPAFACEAELPLAGQIGVHGPVQVNGQQRPDAGARVISFPERFGASKHDESPTPLGYEALEQHHLIASKKVRFDMIQDDGVIAKEFAGGFWESAAELHGVLGIQTHQHRLIVSRGFLVLMPE